MPDTVIVQNLSKSFRRYHADRPRTLREAFLRGWRHLAPEERFWALRDVSLSLAPGRALGVIGPNGAGKSTLLRLIGGVGRPDEGDIIVHGRIGALLGLGAGFHPDLTGRENVFVNGVIAGLTRREVARRLDSIVAFAELEEFIDSPLRTYSSGMRMRLAFAVAVHTEPEILLIDEVLAVGDVAFRRKCFERIDQFKSEGCTILFVSHDVNQIQRLCDEALWLRQGQVVAHGDPQVVAHNYVTEMTKGTQQHTSATPPGPETPRVNGPPTNKNRLGSQELEIVGVRLLDRRGFPVTELDSGNPLCVEIEYSAPHPVDAPIFGVSISCEDRQICCNTNTAAVGLTLPTLQGRGQVTLQFERLDLIGGQYYVNVGVYEQKWAYAYDYHWHVYPLVIRPTNGGKMGILHPPHHWEIGDTRTLQASLSALEAPQLGRGFMTNISFSVSTPSERPIFVFASTQRCGSTLLQRLLNSCPDVLIWGEHTGYLNSFIREYQALLEWESRFSSQRKTFLLEGCDNFVPNMVPEDHELMGAAIAHIVALFAVPAAKLGRSIWGFKEVRYGAQVALFLQKCFPKARFIHLTRNIINCFISLKHWEDSPDPWNRKWTENSMEDWRRINASFLNVGDRIPNLLSVKYEDMVADPKGFVEELSQFLEIAPDSFDQGVFNRRIHNVGSAGTAERSKILPSDLNAEERALLSQPSIVEVAKEYGYKIEF